MLQAVVRGGDIIHRLQRGSAVGGAGLRARLTQTGLDEGRLKYNG